MFKQPTYFNINPDQGNATLSIHFVMKSYQLTEMLYEKKYTLLMIDWLNTSRPSTPVCPIEGSSTTLTFMFDTNVYNGNTKVDIVRRKNIRQTSNFNVELTIYNVTTEDEGIYRCYPVFDHNGVMLEVASKYLSIVKTKNKVRKLKTCNQMITIRSSTNKKTG